MHHQSGYTLIELLIVVVILLLISAMGIPYFNSFSQRQMLKGAADFVQGDLIASQDKARASIRDQTFNCSGEPTPHKVDAYQVDNNGVSSGDYALKRFFDCVSGSDGFSEVYTRNLENNIVVSWPSPNPRFNLPDGKLASSSSLIVRVCNSNVQEHIDVIIEPSGRIYQLARQGGC